MQVQVAKAVMEQIAPPGATRLPERRWLGEFMAEVPIYQ